MKTKSLKRNYIFNLIYNLTNLMVPLIIAPFLSRVLQVDGVGVKSYTFSIVSNFILFATLGISEYGQIEISKNRDNKKIYSKKLYEIGLLRVVTTLIVFVIYICTLVLPIFNNSYNDIYIILIINIIANVIDFSWFLRGIEEFKTITIVQIISKIFLLIGTLVLVKSKADINIAILINSITLLINSVLPLFVIRKYCVRVSLKDLRVFSHLKECLVYFVPAIAIQIYTVLDKTMIGLITNSNTENGYYEQADKVIKILITVVTTTNTIMNSRISYLYQKQDIKEIKRLIDKSTCLCMMIAVPITFGAMAISNIFVPMFFGEGYDKTIDILIVLAPLAIIIGLSGLVGSHYYTPLGKKAKSNKYLIVGAIVNFVLNLLLIKSFKSIGAAIASIVAEFIITFLYIRNSNKKLFNFRFIFKSSYKYFISSIIMYIVLVSIKKYMSTGLITLGILIMVGCFVYVIVLLLLRDSYLFSVINDVKEGGVKWKKKQ